MDAGTINYKIYENGSEYLGTAKVTMPDMNSKTFTVNGAGIAGDIELPVVGHRDAMKVTIEFVDSPAGAYKLAEDRRHLLDLRAAKEEYDDVRGKIVVKPQKYILETVPLNHTGGELAPAASQNAKVEMSVLSYKHIVDGKLMRHFDPAHWIDKGPDGVNRLEEVARALGK